MGFTPSFFATSMLLFALFAITSATQYGYGPTPDLNNPKPEADYQPLPAKPVLPGYRKPKLPGEQHKLAVPTIIGVQGVVLCRSGSNYFPIHGAVTRVTCVDMDDGGYETAPVSVLNNNGYFLATLSISELGEEVKRAECKAFLESSPLETCKVPTDVNYGISGAPLGSHRILNDIIKLHSVGPFIYTSPKPVPNGH